MGTYTNIICSEQNPYTISSTSGTFRFSVNRTTARIGSQDVLVTWALNGDTTVLYQGTFYYGETKSFTIRKTALLNALDDTGTGTLTLRSICSGETVTQTFTVKVDATQIKSQFTSTTQSIQSTPLRGYLISGYSTAQINYNATKGYGATQMDFTFTTQIGEVNPDSATSTSSSQSGLTLLTIPRRDNDISFYTVLEVRDSRGQTVDRRNVETSWKGYTLPQIDVEAFRCDAQGNRDDSGDHVSIMFSGTYSLTGIGNVGHVSLTVGSQTYTDPSTPIILSQAQNVAKTYTIIATDTVINSASETVRKSVTVNMAKFPLDLYDDGQGNLGARVGAIAEPDYFTCGLKQKGIYFYGTCGTAKGTARKTATVDQTFQLYTGVLVFVKFTNSNTIANPTLNVNGTGAKAIKRYGTTAPSTSTTTSWNAGTIFGLMYDGTYWMLISWLNNNTTYSLIAEADIKDSAHTTARLISGQRFSQGFNYYFPTAFTSALTKSAIYSVLGADTEKTVHLGGMSAYSTARNKLRINIPIPTGATISVAIDSGYTSWRIASSSANQTVTVSSVALVDNDISSATIEVTLSSNALTSDRAYNFKNGQIKMTCS